MTLWEGTKNFFSGAKDMVVDSAKALNPFNSVSDAIGHVTDVGSSYLTYKGASEANEANAAMARENRDWQERMSSTAYQRSMEDMRKAGLNPILAYNQGGASTPGGNVSTEQNALGAGVSSARDSMRSRMELQNMQAQNNNLNAQTQQIHASTTKTEIEAMLLKAGIPRKEIERLLGKAALSGVQQATDRVMPSINSAGAVFDSRVKRFSDRKKYNSKW